MSSTEISRESLFDEQINAVRKAAAVLRSAGIHEIRSASIDPSTPFPMLQISPDDGARIHGATRQQSLGRRLGVLMTIEIEATVVYWVYPAPQELRPC